MASQAMVFMQTVTVHNIMKFVATDSVGCLSCEKDTVLLHGRSVFPKPNSPFYSQAAEVHLMQTRLASKKRLASVTQNCCQETQHGETTWRCRSWCERQLLVHSLLHHGSFEWCDHRFAKLLELSYRPCCWAGRKKDMLLLKDVRKLGFIVSHLERSVRKKETEVYLDFARYHFKYHFHQPVQTAVRLGQWRF